MSIFTKVFGAIGHFFGNLFQKAKPFLEKEIPAVIEVLNGLKAGVDMIETGPFKDAFNRLVGVVPAEILQKISTLVPKVVTDLGLAKGVVDQNSTEAVLLAALAAIKQAVPSARAAYYTGIGTLLVTDITEGKLTYNEALIILNKAYQDGVNLHLINPSLPAPSPTAQDPVPGSPTDATM